MRWMREQGEKRMNFPVSAVATVGSSRRFVQVSLAGECFFVKEPGRRDW
jgi:hypothetical protein